MRGALLPEIRRIVGVPQGIPPIVHELYADFDDLRKIDKDCGLHCITKMLHTQAQDHNKLVWSVYTNKWQREHNLTNLQIVELKELYHEWAEQ